MKTSEKIIEFVSKRGQVTAKEFSDFLLISPRAVFKQLGNLIEDGKLIKIGKPPKVFYMLPEKKAAKTEIYAIDDKTRKIIEENFLVITPTGEKKGGWKGFVFWCLKRNQDVEKTAEIYIKTFNKYNAFKKDGFIDGMGKIKSTFQKVFLDKLFYLDFYSLEIFGKTKLGQLLLYAKQSQSKKLIKELIDDIRPKVANIVKKYKIDGVGFIPPTVKRETQFMKELENSLKLPVRKISIVKIKTEVSVPQKTLSKIDDRIENARATIVVDEKNIFKNILLIDDAVGSGATLNETAAKIKERKICQGKVIGLAITGSFKGFDVISEV